MYWFSYLSHLVTKPGNGLLAVEHAAIDMLYTQVEGRVDRAFLGEQWLRRHYGGDRTVEIRSALHDASAVHVVDVRKVNGTRKRVVAEVSLPADWFRGRLDGLLGIRLMTAAVHSLNAIGTAVGIGPCPLRSPGQDKRRVHELQLFQPQTADPLEAAVSRVLDGAPRDGLLLVAGSEEPADRRWHHAVVGRLGAKPYRHDNAEEVSAWSAPLPP